jgi:hypothetical protein
MDDFSARARPVLEDVLAHARREDYLDHSKHDALNSPLLKALFGFSKWTRIAATQAVMRFPLNLRPLLAVPKVQNPKGLSLFVRAQLASERSGSRSGHAKEALALCERLLSLRSGPGWGYHYPWQDLGFYAPARTPNAVVTAFVCEALMDAYEASGQSRLIDAVDEALGFLLAKLPVLWDRDDELCLGYMPMPMSMRVMDVSILIGAAFARHAQLSGKSDRSMTAKRLVNYVVRRQTADGAWFYCDPPQDSPVKIDNYHTGFILDALWQYAACTGDHAYDDAYRRGLRFYAEHLFNPDGSPRWMSDRDFPHDVHGAAQGIITFSRHDREYPGMAARVARWSLDTLYSGSGTFYYQQRRHYTVRTSFMRWCNAWMARALSCLIESRAAG